MSKSDKRHHKHISSNSPGSLGLLKKQNPAHNEVMYSSKMPKQLKIDQYPSNRKVMTGQEHIVVEVDGDFTPAHPGAIVEKDFELAVKFYE
jgi:hypothetical protein